MGFMWIFDYPKSYAEMIKKISLTTFFIILIGIIILAHLDNDLGELIKKLSLGLEYESSGIKLYIGYFYLPLMISLAENMFKLHDKISDCLKIRYKFDKEIIISRFCDQLNIPDKKAKVNSKNRDKIMNDIFYKYAGYAKPVIDNHLIDMALGCWCWYWITLDSCIATIVIGSLILINKPLFKDFTLFAGIICLLVIILFTLKNEAKKYAVREVDEIISDNKRKNEIKEYLKNALHS